MKNSKIITIIAVLVISFCFCANVAMADKSTIGTINAVTVNLREEASSSSKILIQLGEDTEVEILGTSGDWYEVKYNGISGYISKDYVDIEEEGNTYSSSNTNTTSNVSNTVEENTTINGTTTNTVTNTSNTVTTNESDDADNEESTISDEETTSLIDETATEFVLSKDAEIRTIPSFTSNKSTTIASGSTVTVLIELNKWIKITDGNVTGWVIRQNVQ